MQYWFRQQRSSLMDMEEIVLNTVGIMNKVLYLGGWYQENSEKV